MTAIQLRSVISELTEHKGEGERVAAQNLALNKEVGALEAALRAEKQKANSLACEAEYLSVFISFVCSGG
jgi:hypothetical protein